MVKNKFTLEIEQSILSVIIDEFEQFKQHHEIEEISLDYFQNTAAKRIFQAIQRCLEKNKQLDKSGVIVNLKSCCTNESEFNACFDFFNNLPEGVSYFSLSRNLDILKSFNIKKKLDNLCKQIVSQPFNYDNFSDSLTIWFEKHKKITFQNELKLNNSLIAKEAIEIWEKALEDSKDTTNLGFFKSHYLDLDKKIKNFGGGQLIVLASRPGVGKTTFALNLIHNNLYPRKRLGQKTNENLQVKGTIGIFSLEMSTNSLLTKLISINSDLDLFLFRKLFDGELISANEKMVLDRSKKEIAEGSLLFCDNSNVTLGEIIYTVKNWVKTHDLKLVVIDYLQLIEVPSEFNNSQYQKIGTISRQLKLLAMELNICILALSQLNRKIEERRGMDKTPILSDLRESGSIEQDADVVMFLHDVISKNEQKDILESSSFYERQVQGTSGIPISLKIAKNRHGDVGFVDFLFSKKTGTFKSLD